VIATILQKKPLRLILIHAAVWLVYISYELAMLYFSTGSSRNLIISYLNFTVYIFLFYAFALYLLPLLFKHKKYLKFLLSAVLVMALFIGIRYSYVHILFAQGLNYPFVSLKTFLAETVWRGGYFIMLSTGYWVAANLIEAEREMRILEEKRARSEREAIEAENNLKQAQLQYLRNQINPHFLFNTLNFFYSQILPVSPATAEGILHLANIMRYALKDKEISTKALLEDEVEHIRNFIQLYRLRFGERLQVNFEVVGDINFRMILPLVLITFVENSFKYGDLFDAGHPVTIRLRVDDQGLYFYTHNKKKVGPLEFSSNGIGIANTRRRLDLVYQDRYALEVQEDDRFYATTLTIKL
jgi:two-component system, LytTR family, sensor kinase